GFFQPNKQGVLIYHSLLDLVPTRDRGFGDVWDIVEYENEIFFRATKHIFRLSATKMYTFHTSNEWGFMGVCHGRLYIQNNSKGLMIYENGKIQPHLIDGYNPFLSNTITSILRIPNNEVL